MIKSNWRFERDAPTAGFTACFRAPQAKRWAYGGRVPRRLWTALAWLMPAFLIGCVTAPLYEASVTAPAQGAAIRAWSSVPEGWARKSLGTCVEMVDDRLLFDGLRATDQAQFDTGALVDPGVRTLTVSATDWGPINYTGRGKLTATLKPGHTYLLKAERTESLITLWLEDLETREAVSERVTVKASSWAKFP